VPSLPKRGDRGGQISIDRSLAMQCGCPRSKLVTSGWSVRYRTQKNIYLASPLR
jgi:hypothetical protein